MVDTWWLLPQLMPGEAGRLAAELCCGDIRTMAREAELRDLADVPVIYSPTGGNRIPIPNLRELGKSIRGIAEKAGYPSIEVSDRATRLFDVDTGQLLYRQLQISTNEASRAGVWEFLTCILLPDVVRWRFPGRGATPVTHAERFTGGIRNTFKRLWRRAFILSDPNQSDPCHLVRQLSEDELVQVTERPQASANRDLARVTVELFLKTVESTHMVERERLMREAQKRLVRKLPVICFEALNLSETRDVISLLMSDTVKMLSGPGATKTFPNPKERGANVERPERSAFGRILSSLKS